MINLIKIIDQASLTEHPQPSEEDMMIASKRLKRYARNLSASV